MSGSMFALAHLAICLAVLAGAALSAHRARSGVRVNRRGTRYHRLTTEQMMKRLQR